MLCGEMYLEIWDSLGYARECCFFVIQLENWLVKHGSDTWNMVPACLMWLIWKEWNRRTFEDTESSLDQLKTLLAHTLFDWLGFHTFSSILKFQVSFQFSFWDFCTYLTLCVHHREHKEYLIFFKLHYFFFFFYKYHLRPTLFVLYSILGYPKILSYF